MCYTGGPYCASHAKPKMQAAAKAFREESTVENRDAYLKTVLDYESTPTGLKEAQKKIEASNSEPTKKYLQDRLDLAKKRRAAQQKARKEREAKEGKVPAKKKTPAKKSTLPKNEDGRPVAPSERVSTKETAATIRKELREKFQEKYPGTKFSVRMATGTAHGWLSVSYTDGPSRAEVREMMYYYENSSSDPYGDGRNYHQSSWGATGINVSKDFSEETKSKFAEKIETNQEGERYIRNDDGQLTYEQYPAESNVQIAVRAAEAEAEREYFNRKMKEE